MGYLEYTGQADDYPDKRRIAAHGILRSWSQAARRVIRLANARDCSSGEQEQSGEQRRGRSIHELASLSPNDVVFVYRGPKKTPQTLRCGMPSRPKSNGARRKTNGGQFHSVNGIDANGFRRRLCTQMRAA